MVDSTLSPAFYADFSGLTALKKNVKANDPLAIREAARQFESLFTDMMLKSMRAAKLGDGLGDSQQTDFYQDMYDQQLALQMSQGKGLGLADMLVQQLTRSGMVKAAAGSAAAAITGAPAATHAVTTAPTTAPSRAAPGAVSHAARISFVRSIEPYAQRAAAQLGVSSDSLIAQAALETGWGQHVPANGGSSSHNLFGIKAGASWSGESVSASTIEYGGNGNGRGADGAGDGSGSGGGSGGAVRVPQSFRAYSSVQQGVNDYVTLLQRSPGYRQALGTGDDTAAFASALQRGGYATDPDYVHKLVAMVATVRALRAGADPTVAAAGPADTSLKLQGGLPTTSGGDPA